MAWKAFIVSFLAVGIAARAAGAHNATEAQTAKIIATFQMPEILKDLIKAEVADDCKNAKAADKTEDVANAVIQFCDCSFRLIAEENYSLNKVLTAVDQGKVAEFWNTNCDKTVLFRKCLAGFVKGYSPCAQKDLMKSIAILRKDLESILDFACFNDGERLIKLTSQEVMMCLYTEQQGLMECRNKLENTSDYKEAIRSMSSEKVCTKVRETFTCAADVLQGCQTSAPSDFLDEFTKHFQQKSGSCQFEQEL